MPLSPADYVGNLDPLNPVGTDSRTITDNEFRDVKKTVRDSFPNVKGAVTSTHTELNMVAGLTANSAKVMTGVVNSTVIYVYNLTAPYGWTLETLDANIRALMIDNAAPATVGGADDPATLAKDFTITTTGTGTTSIENTAHNHNFSGLTSSASVGNFVSGTNVSCALTSHTHTYSGTTGFENQNHAHTTSCSSSGLNTIAYAPRYAKGILVKLNA